MTLTCPECDKPIDQAVAWLSDEGYVHKKCPDQCTVTTCGEPTAYGSELCRSHYFRNRKHGHPEGGRVVIHVEDVEWMAITGESLTGAAERIGTKRNTLDQHLRRVGRDDLIRTLLRNEPADWNGRQGSSREAVA